MHQQQTKWIAVISLCWLVALAEANDFGASKIEYYKTHSHPAPSPKRPEQHFAKRACTIASGEVSDESAFIDHLAAGYYFDDFESYGEGDGTTSYSGGSGFGFTVELEVGETIWNTAGQLTTESDNEPMKLVPTTTTVTAIGGFFYSTDFNGALRAEEVTVVVKTNFRTIASFTSNSDTQFHGWATYTDGEYFTEIYLSYPSETVGKYATTEKIYLGARCGATGATTGTTATTGIIATTGTTGTAVRIDKQGCMFATTCMASVDVANSITNTDPTSNRLACTTPFTGVLERMLICNSQMSVHGATSFVAVNFTSSVHSVSSIQYTCAPTGAHAVLWDGVSVVDSTPELAFSPTIFARSRDYLYSSDGELMCEVHSTVMQP